MDYAASTMEIIESEDAFLDDSLGGGDVEHISVESALVSRITGELTYSKLYSGLVCEIVMVHAPM
jgi:hypothetical protein